MKDKILIVFLIFLSHSAFSQKMPEDYLNEGNELFGNKNFKEALGNYEYIINNYPESSVYPFALYNSAVSYEKINQTDRAIKIYEQIISTSFDDNLLKSTNSIMENPYANFSFNSCIDLANIYYGRKDFDEALNYYIFADTADLFISFCGNAVAEMNIYLKEKIAKCYLKTGEKKRAIKVLTKEIFNDLFASNEDVVNLLMKILDREYGKEEMRLRLNKCINKIYKRNGEYYILLFGEELHVYEFDKMKYDREMTRDEILEIVNDNKFFKYYLN